MASTHQPTFDDLVERHAPQVFRVCRSILRDDHLGSDAAQETFVKLWRRLSLGALPEHAQGWLRSVAVSTSLDLVRRRRLQTVVEDTESREAPAAARPLEQVSLAELQHDLGLALHELSEGQRTVFLLRHEGGLALREVAEVLGVALPTVKTQFARACVKLQAKLARFDPDLKDGPR